MNGDCPYAGVCTCRASGRRRQTAECKALAKRFINGERIRNLPKGQSR